MAQHSLRPHVGTAVASAHKAHRKSLLLLGLVLLLSGTSASAQVSLTAFGSPVTTDFNGLPTSGSATWTNNSTVPGWFYARTGTGTTIVADGGTNTGGNLYSYGTGVASDRALGSLGSGNAAAGSFFWGIRLQNNTGGTITSLAVSYTGEEWRKSGVTVAQDITVSYLVGSPTVSGSLAEFQSAGVAVPALTFSSPINTATAAALDGNAAANRTAISSTIAGLNIPAGAEIMLRWSDPDHTGADHGLAIDDFSVTPSGCFPAISVTNANDSGAGSLRQAVADLCAGGTITFDAAFFATPRTINQLSALAISKSMTITGPGAAQLTIDGGADTIDGFATSGAIDLSISRLVLTDFLNAVDAVAVASVSLTDLSVTSSGDGGAVNTNYGAVKVIGGDLTLTRVSLSNNTGYLGGAVSMEPQAAGDSLTVTDSTFTSNAANGGGGGAIYVRAFATQSNVIQTSTFASNTGASAGALLLWSDAAFISTTPITNSTFSANSASVSSGADAILGFGDSKVNIAFSTFSGHDNSTGSSTTGVIHATSGADIVLSGSIIANNPQSAGGTIRDCTAGTGGATFTGDNNLSADTICPGRIASPTNVSATLASNGGPTQTHALNAGSNAISAYAGASCPATDQRGTARPVSAADCDLGSYQTPDPCAAYAFPYTLTGNTPAELTAAIVCANSNATADVINLNGQTITLTDSFADYSGATGLPQITTGVTLQNGTLTRSGANLFRIVSVSAAGSLTLRGTTVSNGGGSGYASVGAGISNLGTTTVIGSNIVNNIGSHAVALSNTGTLSVVNSTIAGNFASQYTAILEMSGTVSIANSLISGNKSTSSDNIWVSSGTLTVTNSTVADNYTAVSASNASGAFYKFAAGTLNVQNSIIWGNRNSNNSADQIEVASGAPTVSSSIIEGGVFGGINVDPLFVTPIAVLSTPSTAGDFQLNNLSPATDAGANANVPLDTFDVDGDTNTAEEALDRALAARRYDDTGVVDTGSGTAPIVDLGAYERQITSVPRTVTVTQSGGNTAVSEAGLTDTYTVVLDTAPSANVTIAVTGDADASVSPVSLTFTTANWATPQTVTVTAVNDRVVEGGHTGSIAHSATGGGYDAVSIAGVTATIADNDIADYQVAVGGNVGEAIGTFPIDVTVTFATNGTGPQALQDPITVPFTINPASTATGGGTDYSVVGSSVTIPTDGTFQPISITVVDDALSESNETIIVNLGAETGGTANQQASVTLGNGTYTATILDNDAAAGLTITESGGTTAVVEGGATDSYTVALNSQPSADVTIALTGSQVTTAPSSLTFTAVNWATAQTVIVTAIDDAIDEATPHAGSVSSAVTSADGNYNGISVAAISVAVTDNDTAGITVTPTSGLTTTEAGGTASFTVVLNTQPTADVSVGLTSSDSTEGSVSPVSLTFTSINWNTPQTVTATGVDDGIVDGAIAYTIVTAAAVSGDTNYNGIDPADVAASNSDNDTVGITVTQSGGTTVVSETGTTDSYSLVLTSQPSADVTIAIAGTADATVSPTSLLFTSANWNTPQTVTVTAVNDLFLDDDLPAVLSHSASSSDGAYQGIAIANVSVAVADDESLNYGIVSMPGFLTSSSGLESVAAPPIQIFGTMNGSGTGPRAIEYAFDVSVSASGGTATGGVDYVLNSPVASFTTAATFSGANTFASVALAIVNDAVDEADETVPMAVAANELGTSGSRDTKIFRSGAPQFQAHTYTINDDDSAGLALAISGANTAVTEGGATDTFTAALQSQPASDVTVSLTGTQVTTAPTSLTFTSANWNVAQTVTVTAIDDAVAEASPHAGQVSFVLSSADAGYNALAAPALVVQVTDNDGSGVAITQSAGANSVSEAGATDSYTIVLGSQPTANVDVAISFPASDLTLNGDTDGTYNTTFTTANWNTPQTITVAAVNDRALEGNHGGTLTHAFTSGDAGYNGITATVDGASSSNALAVAISDNESAQLSWTSTSTSAGEGSTVFTGVQIDITADPVGGTPTLEGTLGYSITPAFTSAEPADIGAPVGTLSFSNVSDLSSNPISIAHLDDTLIEGSESYTAVLSLAAVPAGMSVSVAPTPFSADIFDGDVALLFMSGPAPVSESIGSLPLTVSLSAAAGNTMENATSVVVSLTDGSATFAGGAGDYFFSGPAASATVNFPAGASVGATQVVNVSIREDVLAEGPEVFSASLGSPVGPFSSLGGTTNLSISDNDTAAVSFAAASSSVSEATTPHSVNALLTITAVGTGTPALERALFAVVADTPGTATTPGDYSLSTTLVIFPAGAQTAATQPISIDIVDDLISEAGETFSLDFGSVSPPGSASGSHTVTITDNDNPGITVTESAGNTAVTEGGATDSYSIVLNSQPTSDVTINIAYDPAQVSLNGDADGSYSRVFTSANWNVAQVVTVTAVDDTVVETNPHGTSIVQTVASGDPVYAAINPADVAVSIAENDSQQIVFALASSSVAETAGTHVVNARLNLTANGAPGGTISAAMSANVFLTLASAEPADLSLGTAQLTFAAGSAHNAVQPINLTLVNDRLLEGAETATLSLGLVGSLGSVSGTHALTLTDDEVGVISYSAPSSATSESAGTYLGAISRLTISGTGTGGAGFASEANVDVTITDTAGSATSPADYARITATQTFLAGAVSPVDVPVSVGIANDVLIENVESFSLGFGSISGAGSLSASGAHTVSITDNDTAVVAFAANNDSVGEGVGSFGKPVTLTLTANGVGTASLQNAIVVPVGFTEGSATEPEDFTLSSASLTFNAGATSGTSLNATAAIVNDVISEASESFDLTLGNAFVTPNITLGRAASTVTITDNDVPGVTITQSAGATTVTEGGATDSYTVVLNSQPTAEVSIAINAGTQLSTAPTNLIFTGATWNIAQTVTVTAVDDAVAEGSHNGSISHAATSSDAVYNGIPIASVTATITDNDTAGVTVVESAGSTVVTEGGATDTYTVVLTSQPTANVAIALAVSPQLSTAPSNLTFTSANWNVAQTLTVTATDDAVVEGPHSGAINQSASSSDPNYSAISVASVNASISDNDSAVVNFAPTSVSQTEATSPMAFTITLSNPVASGVTLTLNSANGSAGAADYTPIVGATVSFAASSTTPQTINVAITNDALDEANETFGLTLSNLVATGNVTLGAGAATGTILDDDATPTLSITSPSAPEGNAGSSVMNFVVSLSAISGQDVTFTRATADGSATTANNDYVAIGAALATIPAGQSSLTIPVTINGDTAFEGNETFSVNLSAISNATPTSLTGTGTIQEDDQQPTTTTITSDTPDPSVTGQPYTVNVTVAAQTTSPLGTVTISDGSASCGPVTLTTGTSPNSSASCNLTSTSAGAKTLTATYAPASSAFAASSGTTAHQVNAASTAISVVGPTRSRINQPTTFTFALSVNAPGGGSPAGTVTLSSGASTCNVTVPTATPSCALTFTALGARTVTAAFAPSDGSYTASSAAGAGNAQTLVYALSDIAVTKTDAVSVYRPGELIVYTVTVRNNGPDTAVNIRVRDNVPAGLSNVTWSCDASGGVACAPTGGSGNLDVTVASMASGALLNYTFFGNVSGSPGQIANTALVELPADTTVEDPNPSNNSATDTDVLDNLFKNGFEDVGVNAPTGSYRLPSAALRSALDEVAVVVYRLSDANGEALRVYARVLDGQMQYALATRDATGALRLGAWASYAAEPSLRWTARQQAAGWVMEGAELR